MTPRELAEKTTVLYAARVNREEGICIIEQAIIEAVAAERERCAVAVEELTGSPRRGSTWVRTEEIAAAIRALN